MSLSTENWSGPIELSRAQRALVLVKASQRIERDGIDWDEPHSEEARELIHNLLQDLYQMAAGPRRDCVIEDAMARIEAHETEAVADEVIALGGGYG